MVIKLMTLVRSNTPTLKAVPRQRPQGEALVLCNSLVVLVMVGVAVRDIIPTHPHV